jgi:hypothetical protein
MPTFWYLADIAPADVLNARPCSQGSRDAYGRHLEADADDRFEHRGDAMDFPGITRTFFFVIERSTWTSL